MGVSQPPIQRMQPKSVRFWKTYLIVFLNTFVLLLFFTKQGYSQNLVPNPSFEEQTNYESYITYLNSLGNNKQNYSTPTIDKKPFKILKNWMPNSLGNFKFIDNTLDYSKEKYFYWKKCLDAPYDGNYCLGLSAYHLLDERSTNTAYLQVKLRETLQVGSIYRIAVWFSIPKEYNKDSVAVEHIGLSFLRKPIEDIAPYLINKNWKFTIHNPPYNQWFETVWYLRPLCELDYLVIGATHTKNWPTKYGSATSLAFVDNISIIKVSEDSIINNHIITTPFCKSEEWDALLKESIFEDKIVHFNTNSYAIENNNQEILNQIITYDKLNPLKNVYEIKGFADNTGNENIELSKNRAEAVKKYFIEYGKMDSLQFVINWYGTSMPISSSNTIQDRYLNRRVQLSKSESILSQQVYHRALELIGNKQYNLSFIYLKKWLDVAPNLSKIFLLFDPRLLVLKQDKKWNMLYLNIKETYKYFKFPDLSFYLDSLNCEDQRNLSLTDEINNLSSAKLKDSLQVKEKDVAWQNDSIRQKMFLEIKAFIIKHGLPGEVDFGKRPASTAFLLIQHTNDTNDLAKYVELFRIKCLAGETNWNYYAMLKDNLLKQNGKKLMYATLRCPTIINGKTVVKFCDSEPLEKVNLERRKIGLYEYSEEAFQSQSIEVQR